MTVGLGLKVVLDTNVFISGVFFKGPPYQILKEWRAGSFELVVSQEILDEYRRVGEILSEKYTSVDLTPFLRFVIEYAKRYEPVALNSQVSEDPDDDKFFACALASKSKMIISGDKHLLQVREYQGIKVLKPRDFIDGYLAKR